MNDSKSVVSQLPGKTYTHIIKEVTADLITKIVGKETKVIKQAHVAQNYPYVVIYLKGEKNPLLLTFMEAIEICK